MQKTAHIRKKLERSQLLKNLCWAIIKRMIFFLLS
jgi:hypothetical protein